MRLSSNQQPFVCASGALPGRKPALGVNAGRIRHSINYVRDRVPLSVWAKDVVKDLSEAPAQPHLALAACSAQTPPATFARVSVHVMGLRVTVWG